MPSLFPYRPFGSLVETWEWNTNLFPAAWGAETRRSVIDIPLQSWEWTIIGNDAIYQAFTHGNRQASLYVPIWQDAEITTGPVNQSATSVTIADASIGDWRDYLVLWASPTQCEVLTISSIDGNTINLGGSVSVTYPTGSTVAPGRLARLDAIVRLQDRKNFTILGLTWLITDTDVLASYDWPIQYDSKDVITEPLLTRDEGVEREWQNATDILDYKTGIRGFASWHEGDRILTPTMDRIFSSRAALWTWKKWLHKIQGRLTEFWLPSFKNDITIAASFLSTATTLDIEHIGYTDYLLDLPSHKYIYFQRPGSLDPICRKIEDSTEVSGTVERLTIDAELGISGGPRTFPYISWLHPCRLDSDRVEITYEAGNRAAFSVPVKSLLRDVDLPSPVGPIPIEDPPRSNYDIALVVNSKTDYNYATNYHNKIESLGWNVDIFLPSELPAPSADAFDCIICVGWPQGVSYAYNCAVKVLPFYNLGVPVLLGSGANNYNDSVQSLWAYMGITNSSTSSNLTYFKDPSIHQTTSHVVLNGTDIYGNINPRPDLPQSLGALKNTLICLSSREFVHPSTSHQGISLGTVRLTTRSEPIDVKGETLIVWDRDEPLARMAAYGEMEYQWTLDVGTNSLNVIDNLIKWLIRDFGLFTAIPYKYEPTTTYHDFANGLPTTEKFPGTLYRVWRDDAGQPDYSYITTPTLPSTPGSYSSGAMHIESNSGGVTYPYPLLALGWVSDPFMLHFQFIPRTIGAGSNWGIFWDMRLENQDINGRWLMDGYTFYLNSVNGACYRFYSNFVGGQWVQAWSNVFNTTGEWVAHNMYNVYVAKPGDGKFYMRNFIDGACPNSTSPWYRWDSGRVDAGGHTDGYCGIVAASATTTDADFTFFRIVPDYDTLLEYP